MGQGLLLNSPQNVFLACFSVFELHFCYVCGYLAYSYLSSSRSALWDGGWQLLLNDKLDLDFFWWCWLYSSKESIHPRSEKPLLRPTKKEDRRFLAQGTLQGRGGEVGGGEWGSGGGIQYWFLPNHRLRKTTSLHSTHFRHWFPIPYRLNNRNQNNDLESLHIFKDFSIHC